MATEPEVDANPSKEGKGGLPIVPLLIVVLVIPVVTLALTEFVIIPRLQSSLGGDSAEASADAGHGSSGGGHSSSSGGGHGSSKSSHGGGHGKEEDAGPTTSYEFSDIICNLSGTMGTRFLKVSFEVAGSDPELSGMIRMKRPRVKDAIITALSSRTIKDIEVPGGRNALRVALITSINQAIGFEAVEELYFTDFIIQ